MNPSILTKKLLGQILYLSKNDIVPKKPKKGPAVFKGRELVSYILKNHNENKLPRDEIAVFVADSYASPESTTRLIWPVKGRYFFSDSSKTFLFLPEFLEHLAADPTVLNLDPSKMREINRSMNHSMKKKFEASRIKLPKSKALDDQPPTKVQNEPPAPNLGSIEDVEAKPTYFFEDFFKSMECLQDMEVLVGEIQMTMLRIKGQAIDDETFKVDYDKVEALPEFKTDFQRLIGLLPFVDLESITSNRRANVAFFINLYNILTIHSLVTWKKEKGTMVISTMQRASYFGRYKYCIGGYLLCLNDIEHGILRGGDNFGNSGFRVFIAGLFTHSYTDHSRFRFSKRDGRRQLVLTDETLGTFSSDISSYSSCLFQVI